MAKYSLYELVKDKMTPRQQKIIEQDIERRKLMIQHDKEREDY